MRITVFAMFSAVGMYLMLAVFLRQHPTSAQPAADQSAAPDAITLDIPKVIIGCWQLLERDHDEGAAVSTLLKYADAGFTAFDTADIYGPSERILGKFRAARLKANPAASSPRFFTKYVTDDTTAAQANRINSQSRASLGVEQLDMVQFHWWSLQKDGTNHRHIEAARQLMRLHEERKIRHVAACNFDTVNLASMVDDGVNIVANQVQYSLLDRRPEISMLPYCKTHNIKLTVFGVVGGGLLSDHFLGLTQQQAQSQLGSVSRQMYWTSLQRWTRGDWQLFQRLLRGLDGISKAHSVTIAAVASAWVLAQLDSLGAGGGLILGVRDDRHLAEHKALLDSTWTLKKEELKQIQEILDEGAKPQGDVWYHERGWM